MTAQHDSYTNARFEDAGARAGYASRSSNDARQADSAEAMFSGRLSYESFSSGVSLYFSDMVSRVESEHDGVLARSWTLAINLGEAHSQLTIDNSGQLLLPASGGKVLCVSDQVQMSNHIMPGERCRSLLLTISPGMITDAELAEAIDRATGGTSISDVNMTERLRYLALCLAEPVSTGAAGRLLAESRALELLAHVFGQRSDTNRSHPSHLSHRDHLALQRVRDVIHAAPGRDFTLQDLATEAGMSLSSLKVKFPQAFGQTVFAYLREVRLTYAYERIVNEGWTITQAAHFAGYRHMGNFSKAFRRRFGIKPVDAR
ncbi:MAG: AraC family transcriptional regulator [Pseudomonadota bacterium]